MSWSSATTALPTEHDPRVVFERMFGETGSTDAAVRLADLRRHRSILDSVTDAVVDLGRGLGPSDRLKIDEYLAAVRDIERRIQKAEERGATTVPVVAQPTGIPQDFEENLQLMFDLQVLAYQSDVTRVITFMVGREFSSRAYPQIGVAEAHHPLSHHQNDRGEDRAAGQDQHLSHDAVREVSGEAAIDRPTATGRCWTICCCCTAPASATATGTIRTTCRFSCWEGPTRSRVAATSGIPARRPQTCSSPSSTSSACPSRRSPTAAAPSSWKRCRVSRNAVMRARDIGGLCVVLTLSAAAPGAATRDVRLIEAVKSGQPGRGAGTGEPARRRQRARRRWGHRARVGGVPREPGRDRSAASSGRDGECRQRSRRDAAVGRRQPRQRGDDRTTPGRRGKPEPRAGHRRHAADARRAQWRRGLSETAPRPRRQRQRQGRRERTDGADVGDRAAATGGRGGPARRRCRRPRPLEVLPPRRAACAVPRGPAIPRAQWSSIRAG